MSRKKQTAVEDKPVTRTDEGGPIQIRFSAQQQNDHGCTIVYVDGDTDRVFRTPASTFAALTEAKARGDMAALELMPKRSGGTEEPSKHEGRLVDPKLVVAVTA